MFDVGKWMLQVMDSALHFHMNLIQNVVIAITLIRIINITTFWIRFIWKCNAESITWSIHFPTSNIPFTFMNSACICIFIPVDIHMFIFIIFSTWIMKFKMLMIAIM
jgi:hypothetical protein